MEGPGRSRVRGLISKALQFRNATVPKMNVPLTILFLAHDDFKRNVERWLRKTVVDFKFFAIPLFLPTRHLREAACPKIREFLHKHRKAETWWTAWDPATIPCCCARLQTHSLCPDDSSDHLAVNLEDLSLPPDPCLFSDVNANSTYYWSKTPYLQLATNRFRTWLKQDILEQHF